MLSLRSGNRAPGAVAGLLALSRARRYTVAMLTNKELAHYEACLLAKQAEVETQFAQTEEMAAPVAPDPAYGRLSRQDAMQDQQMTLETRRRLVLQRTQIGTALDRIEKGVFGMCVLCKEAIHPQRLEILPESPLCVACQEKRNAEQGTR